MICQNCGSNEDLNALYCSKCGQQLQRKNASEKPVKETFAKKKIPLWFKFIAGLAVVLALLASFVIAFSDDLEGIARSQLESLQANQITEAYYKYTSKEFRSSTTLDEFHKFIKTYPIFANHTSLAFNSSKVENNIGVLEGTLAEKDGHSAEVEYKLVKEDNQWKIASIILVEPEKKQDQGEQAPSEKEIDEIMTPIHEQLKALHENNIENAYEGLSKEFKKVTSLEAFRHFVSQYPLLNHYQSMDNHKPEIENDIVKVIVKLQDEKRSTSIEYILGLEDNQWKIWGMQILKNPEEKTSATQPNFQTKDLLEIVQNELKALKQKDFSTAYTKYTSDSFKKENPFDAFKDFFVHHPLFFDHKSSDFSKISFQGSLAVVEGFLITNENVKVPIDFSLISEGDDWKIQQIEIHPNEPEKNTPASQEEEKKSATEPLQFAKALIGTEVDSKGLVTHPTTTIKSRKSDIIINLFVKNGKAGLRIEMLFKHLDSNSSIPPISTTLQQDGETTVSFVFSPPKEGWPQGIYEADAKASSGESQAYNFKVE